ncbi:hypothetical protein PCC7418_0070 [Halothece sp. PCC 7418]|uniref:Ig-like domain-containing protein n=1 Tax=Halothece sp. (strain PCC 7418) TaxID=65093 RepID=UPI0002A08D01|nr:Ig-like domain-containing protein [Halothece sp. PCC 7418]AFZ42319.1 hypothetical protein PCC7418_0070 [Halothece sp. PCC 7418]
MAFGIIDTGADGQVGGTGENADSISLISAGGNSITAEPTEIEEADQDPDTDNNVVTFTISIPDSAGETVPVTIETIEGDINADDVEGPLPTEITLDAEGNATVELAFVADESVDEGEETFTLKAELEAEDVTSPEVTVADTSTADGGGDTTPPELEATTPADDAVDVDVAGDLSLDFNENVEAGTGDITITDLTDDSSTQTIPVTDAQVSIADDIVTINPTDDLEAGTEYEVTFDAGVFQDIAGNDFDGIAAGDFSFTTADGGGDFTDENIDGQGSLENPATFDAGTDAFNFIDSVDQANAVDISNFGADDQITFQGVIADDVSFQESNGNTQFDIDDGAGTVSRITLLGVTTGAFDVNGFNDSPDFGDVVFA